MKLHPFAIVLIAALLCVAIAPGASTSSVKHKDSLGTVMVQDNPNTYLEGTVTAIAFLDKGIVVRIQPRGTYALFTEDILMCGTSVEKFEGKSNPMVLTYETVAHIAVEGVGCHELKSVDEVKPTKGAF